MSFKRLFIVVIGAGPVGTGLALLFRKHGHHIAAVGSRSVVSARKLSRLVGGKPFGTERVFGRPPRPLDLSKVDLVVLTVPDGRLSSLVKNLTAVRLFPVSTRFVHTSGSLTSEVLLPLAQLGHKVCSMHPVQSFPPHVSPRDRLATLSGIWFGLEGSRAEERWVSRFVTSLGCHPFRVPKEAKILYHLACTFASNYSVALVGVVEEIARSLRIGQGLRPFKPLVNASLRNALVKGPRASLTGPVMRGGVEVLRRHARAIRRHAPHLENLFEALVSETARQGVQGKRITAKTARAVKAAVKR